MLTTRNGPVLTNAEHAPGNVPNADWPQQDWEEVSDKAELTDADIAELRPDGVPDKLADALARRRDISEIQAPLPLNDGAKC